MQTIVPGEGSCEPQEGRLPCRQRLVVPLRKSRASVVYLALRQLLLGIGRLHVEKQPRIF